MPHIESEALDHAEYDPATRTLSLWWKGSGRRYDYQAVPPEVYAAFMASDSKGEFANRVIKPGYRVVKR